MSHFQKIYFSYTTSVPKGFLVLQYQFSSICNSCCGRISLANRIATLLKSIATYEHSLLASVHISRCLCKLDSEKRFQRFCVSFVHNFNSLHKQTCPKLQAIHTIGCKCCCSHALKLHVQRSKSLRRSLTVKHSSQLLDYHLKFTWSFLMQVWNIHYSM